MTNREVIAAWDEHARTHAPFGPQGDFAREHLLNPAIFELLGPPAGLRILDAGCGGGSLCRLLARAGADATGIEPSASIAHARRPKRPTSWTSATCRGIYAKDSVMTASTTPSSRTWSSRTSPTTGRPCATARQRSGPAAG